MKIIIRTLSLFFFFLPILTVSGQAPELSADAPIAYSEETGMLIATGNAVYTDEDTTVEADEILYNRDTNRIEASGNVRVTRKGIRLLANSVTYDATNKTFSADRFRAGYPPAFISGESFSGSLEEIIFNNINLYFREPVPGSAKLSVGRSTYISEESLTAEDVGFSTFGGLQLPLPGFTYTFGTPSMDLDVSAGYSDNLGAYLQTEWLYPFFESLSAGANLDIYSRRGLLAGPILRYQSPDKRITAFLNTGYIHDNSRKERGIDILGIPIEEDRGFADFGIQLRNEGSLQFQGRGTYLSDSEVLRDFRSSYYFDRYHPDTFADFTWQKDHFLLNVFARSQINDFYQMVERLPELRAEWLPSEIARTGVYIQAAATATRYRLQEIIPSTGTVLFPSNPFGLASTPVSGGLLPGDLVSSEVYQRLDGTATLTRPFHGPAGIDLIIRGGVRWTYYNSDNRFPSGTNSDEGLMGEIGFDLSQTLARTYSLDLPKLGIDRLYHQSKTSIKYRWHPGAEESPNAPPFDLYPYHANPAPLDLADLWHVDGLRDWSIARFGWEHEFKVAAAGEAYREFLRLNFYQDLLLNEDPGEDQWDAFYVEADFTPASWFRLSLAQKFKAENFTNEAAFLRATVRSSDLWYASFQAEYLKGAIEQYQLDGWYRLSETVGFFGNWQYDAFLKTWSQQRYGVSKRFANTWQVELYITLTDADDRQGDFGVGIRVNWLSF